MRREYVVANARRRGVVARAAVGATTVSTRSLLPSLETPAARLGHPRCRSVASIGEASAESIG